MEENYIIKVTRDNQMERAYTATSIFTFYTCHVDVTQQYHICLCNAYNLETLLHRLLRARLI